MERCARGSGLRTLLSPHLRYLNSPGGARPNSVPGGMPPPKHLNFVSLREAIRGPQAAERLRPGAPRPEPPTRGGQARQLRAWLRRRATWLRLATQRERRQAAGSIPAVRWRRRPCSCFLPSSQAAPPMPCSRISEPGSLPFRRSSWKVPRRLRAPRLPQASRPPERAARRLRVPHELREVAGGVRL